MSGVRCSRAADRASKQKRQCSTVAMLKGNASRTTKERRESKVNEMREFVVVIVAGKREKRGRRGS